MNDSQKLQQLLNKAKSGQPFSKGDQDVFNQLKKKYSLNDDGHITTAPALGRIMNVSKRTIFKWKKQGMPVELDGSYDVDRILAWRGEKPAKQKTDSEVTDDTEAEISEKTRWNVQFRKYRSKISELDYLQKKGQLIEREAVKDLLVARITEFKQNLLQRARRLSVRLAHKDAQTIQETLETDSYEIMEYYSRENPITGKVNTDA